MNSMSYYYIGLYIISIWICIALGAKIFYRYKNISGLFFLLFSIFGSIWYFLYFLYYSGIESKNTILIISRLGFYFGLISLYSLIIFIYFFKQSKEKILTAISISILGIYSIIGYVYIFTDKIVHHMVRDQGGFFREVYGSWYNTTTLFYIVFIIGIIFGGIYKVKRHEGLEKIRIKKILIGIMFLTFIILFLQVLLPFFQIWIFEKEMIFIFAGFVLYISFILRKYYFTPLIYSIGKLLVGILSITVSISLMNLIKFYFINFHSNDVISYWGWNDGLSIIDSIIALLIYIVFYNFIGMKILGDDSVIHLKSHVRELEKKISQFTDMESVGKALDIGLHKIFHSGRAYIQLFHPEETENNELQRFFLKEIKHEIYISDIAFMDDHIKDFDIKKIEKQIPKDIILILPLYSSTYINIGGLFIGKKPFGDFYTENEIKTLKEFSFFLETHLKYIRVYDMLRDMTENLDKKVDEKTLEYNDLINRQKDFIRMISHEIRSPIGSAIFQSDSIIDDIESGEYDKKHIKEELNILSEQLIKTGDILTKLFSVEYYDVHSVSLFRENIDIYSMFDEEIALTIKTNPKIHFINGIDKNIGFASIDKIQFRQVITNLLSNAIKFATNKKPTILIEGYKENGEIHIGIEDNGPGFEGIDTKNIFDKYTVGKGNRVGLGMGLYLCKRILEMHSGIIQAKPGSHLGGARFDIIIPHL